MKTVQIDKYQCEICKNIYDTIEQGKKCEDRGRCVIPDDIFVTDPIVMTYGDKMYIGEIIQIGHQGVHIKALPPLNEPITEFYHITNNKVIKVELPPFHMKGILKLLTMENMPK